MSLAPVALGLLGFDKFRQRQQEQESGEQKLAQGRLDAEEASRTASLSKARFDGIQFGKWYNDLLISTPGDPTNAKVQEEILKDPRFREQNIIERLAAN